MRQWPGWFLLLLIFAGCSSGSKPFARGGSGASADRLPPPVAPVNFTSKERQKQAGGVLAGRVVDSYNQPRIGAHIELVPVESKNGDKPKPVIADAQGHFIIRGLEPGRKYKLVGKTRPGDPPLQGTVFATPPNVVLLLTLNEDAPEGEATKPVTKENDSSDPTPAKSTGQGKQYLHEPDKGPGNRLPPTNVPPSEPSQVGRPGGDKPSSVQIGTPVEPDTKTETPPIKLRPESVTDNRRQGVPPVAQIPQPTPFPQQQQQGADSGTRSPSPDSMPVGEMQVQDLSGKPVSLATYRGRLVLVDLWSSTSPACIRALREVANLHKTYGNRGLDVVGIAYEDGTLALKSERVKFITTRQGADYTHWLGGGDNCPLLKQLEIQKIPTTLLLDGEGKVLWRAERLTPESRAQLETILKQRLREP